MRIGTMTSLFRECRETNQHTGYLESMCFCKEAGFQVLDFNMCSLLSRETEISGEDWEQKAYEIRNEAEKMGLEFSQSHPPYRPFKDARFKTAEEEERFAALTRRAIRVSGILGVKWAVVHPVTETQKTEFNLQADLQANREAFSQVLELAEKEQVGIAFENMCDRGNRRRFGSTIQELLALMELFQGAPAGICWDTGHGHRVYTDQIPPLQMAAPYLRATHIDDNFGEDDLHLLPFLGTIPWERVMKTLKEIGYQGDLIYEIRLNNHMPQGLKTRSAQFSREVGEYLLTLC